MAYARLEDALRNTLPVDPALIPEDPNLPMGYSAWQDKYGTVHITSWRGTVYEVQEYNCMPDGTVTPGNRVTRTSKLRIVLVSTEGFTTPEEIVMDQKPGASVGAASVFGSFGSLANSVGSAVGAIGSAIGGAVSSLVQGASSMVKGVVDKVKSFFNPAAASPAKVVGEITNKAGGILGGSSLEAGSGSTEPPRGKLVPTMKPEDSWQAYDAPGSQLENPFAVKIMSAVDKRVAVVFNVSPTVDESASATYDSYQPVHFPSAIQVYKATNARTLNVNGKFISRTPLEASKTLEFLNYIRSWVMPYFGKGTAESNYKDKLGAPPDVLYLSAYGKYNLKSVPVVMLSYSWTYPDDIDYIPSELGHPVPRIIDVSMSFLETHAPKEFESFDIEKYRDGKLDEAYKFTSATYSNKTRRNSPGPWFGESSINEVKRGADESKKTVDAAGNITTPSVNASATADGTLQKAAGVASTAQGLAEGSDPPRGEGTPPPVTTPSQDAGNGVPDSETADQINAATERIADKQSIIADMERRKAADPNNTALRVEADRQIAIAKNDINTSQQRIDALRNGG